jgi:hypothetical protein
MLAIPPLFPFSILVLLCERTDHRRETERHQRARLFFSVRHVFVYFLFYHIVEHELMQGKISLDLVVEPIFLN